MKENKKSIEKTLRTVLLVALFGSVGFVAGIPCIIFGATNSWWPLLVLGIILVVFGFYGTPLLWVNYGSLKTQKRVVDAINEEHLTNVAEIASQLQMKDKDVREYIRKGINKKYITGFLYDGNTLTPNEKQAPKKKIVQSTCPNCGGRLETTEKGYTCPYCGSSFEKQ